MKKRNRNAYVPIKALKYQTIVREGGCIVCFNEFGQHVPALFHHAKFCRGYGQARDHMIGFGLCYEHHDCKASGVAFHRIGRRPWEAKFGYERELYIQNNKRLGLPLQPGYEE